MWGVLFTAEAERVATDPSIVRVTVTASNATSGVRRLHTGSGDCAVLVRAFGGFFPDGEQVNPRRGVPCSVSGHLLRLKPGESGVFPEPAITMSEILGLRFRPDDYHFAATVRLILESEGTEERGTIELYAGSVHLPD